MRCTVNGKFKTCSKQGGTTYLCVQGDGQGKEENDEMKGGQDKEKNKIEEPKFFNFQKHKVDGGRPRVGAIKTPAGAYLALVQRLKKNQAAGISYSIINKFFRKQMAGLDSDFMVGSFIWNALTYDPKNDTPLSYDDVFLNLERVPESVDFGKIWDAIDGLRLDCE